LIAATFHVHARIARGTTRALDAVMATRACRAFVVSRGTRGGRGGETTRAMSSRVAVAAGRDGFSRVSSRDARDARRETRARDAVTASASSAASSASSSASSSLEPTVEGRPTCARCRRAAVVCVCACVDRALGGRRDARIQNRTRVHIMQDRHEFRRALGSAVVCALALERCDVRVLFEDLRAKGDAVAPPKEMYGVPFENLGLLWPSEDAVDLETYARERAETSTSTSTESHTHTLEGLIVLDTTWHRAKAMYHRIPWLERVPKYRIDPRRKSNYRIRKQPNDACLSTAECVSEALVALEPDIGAERLSRAFDYMIDDQLDAEANAEARGARETVSGAGRRRPSAALARARAQANVPSSAS
jgi:DTW domain-containing protein YfiP